MVRSVEPQEPCFPLIWRDVIAWDDDAITRKRHHSRIEFITVQVDNEARIPPQIGRKGHMLRYQTRYCCNADVPGNVGVEYRSINAKNNIVRNII